MKWNRQHYIIAGCAVLFVLLLIIVRRGCTTDESRDAGAGHGGPDDSPPALLYVTTPEGTGLLARPFSEAAVVAAVPYNHSVERTDLPPFAVEEGGREWTFYSVLYQDVQGWAQSGHLSDSWSRRLSGRYVHEFADVSLELSDPLGYILNTADEVFSGTFVCMDRRLTLQSTNHRAAVFKVLDDNTLEILRSPAAAARPGTLMIRE